MVDTCCSCGYVNQDGVRFCGACGRALATVRGAADGAHARTSCIGRQRELEALHTRLAAARAGRGGLIMVVGEAGIGKTTIAQAFAEEVRPRGALVLWGACFEGDWQPSYGPWVEAFSRYVRAGEPETLRRQLSPVASPLAQLLPEVRTTLPDTPAATPLGVEEERFRLYDAVVRLLLAAAQEQPVVVILDDLHWADDDSLQLLRYVVRFAAQARLLIVGTYRDVDLDRRHPLSDMLTVLRRETDYERIPVRGLNPTDVAAYLAQAAEQELPQVLTQAIYTETNGNPFYVSEVFRHLVEEGKIVRRADRWSTDFSIDELGIPEGVRRVIGRRISRLAAATATLLRFAAAFSGGFQFQMLQALTGLREDVLLDCIDEALAAGLIRVTGGTPATYDFVHAIVRHTLYDELNPDRRARQHRRIAEALEQVYPGRALDYAAELAVQYHASAALPGASRGVPYALAAAEQARTAYAHERAVTFLRIARDLASDGSAALRADICCQLAIAEAQVLMLTAAHQSVDAALAALAAIGASADVVASFLANVARALKDGGASPAVWEPLVARGLALVEDHHDLIWARLTLLLDRFAPVAHGSISAGRWLGHEPEAVAIARTSGDEDDYARTLEPTNWNTPQETQEVLALARTWQRPTAIMRALSVVANDLFTRHGALREAAERLEELLATAERYGSIPGQAEALTQLTMIHAALGAFPLARRRHEHARQVLARLGAEHRLQSWRPWLGFTLAYYLEGDWPRIAGEADRWVAEAPSSMTTTLLAIASLGALAYARAGSTADARRLLAQLTPVLERTEPILYSYGITLHLAASTIWELGAAELAGIYRQLGQNLIAAGVGDPPLGSNALTIARMAALLGDLAEAGDYFERARRSLDASGQRPLRAIVDYDEALAWVRAGSPNRSQIAALLDAAGRQFRALDMPIGEQRALGLKAQVVLPPPDRPQTSVSYPGNLTTREIEVLRLIGAGATNKEIATQLVVSIATVERHVANIYNKIGVRNRAEATAFALYHGFTRIP